MSNRHYLDILSRTADDTGISRDVLDTICKCFLYELAEELAQRTVELPYIGDISLRNKKYDPNKFVKDLKNRGGSHAYRFRLNHAELIKGSNRSSTRDSNSSGGQTAGGRVSQNEEDNISVSLQKI